MRPPLRSDEARGVANLAIDLGDPGRMSRARRMHRANAVAEVEVLAGIAHATVTDANSDVHEVSIAVASSVAKSSLPSSDDLEPSCTCDDRGDACTHALAALLGIAEEIEANGRLLEVWAGGAHKTPTATYTRTLGVNGAFFDGAWTSNTSVSPLADRILDNPPLLVADELDAGPIIVDAIASVRRGLSRYRAQR